MDYKEVLTIVGTGIGVVGVIHQFFRSFKKDFEDKYNKQDEKFLKSLNMQDERIFLLATGKTLKEAMIEAKKKMEDRG
jgi:hypothetical protein